MGKAILFSLLVVTLVIPIRAARQPSRRQGLNRVILQLSAFCFVYLILCLAVYPYVKK